MGEFRVTPNEESLEDAIYFDGFNSVKLEMNVPSDLPQIAITPTSPGPKDGSTHYTGNSDENYFERKPGPLAPSGQTMGLTNYWRPNSPLVSTNLPEAQDYFACRDSIIQNVIKEVETVVRESEDGKIKGTWLLTEIDYWDNEKERMVVLCENTIVVINYNFIAMRMEEIRVLQLSSIDKLIQGELKYPDHSLTPKLSGLAGGLAGVVKDCIIPGVSGTVRSLGSIFSRGCDGSVPPTEAPLETAEEAYNSIEMEKQEAENAKQSSSISQKFEARGRNGVGVRIIWNEEQPLSFRQRWNPFDKSIPWITLASHPLLWHDFGEQSEKNGSHLSGPTNCQRFNVDHFSRELMETLCECGGGDGNVSPVCRVEYKPIVIENYLGLTALVHNANALGFYKVRGKVSF